MKKHDDLNKLLDYMEEHIDLSHIAKAEQLQYDALYFRDLPYLPLTIRTSPDGFSQIQMDVAFNNPELMLYNEILWSTMHSSYNSVRMKDDCALMVRANFGIGVIPSMFGCKISVFNNNMPWVTHIELDDAVKQLKKGVPDLTKGLGQRVIDTYEYYRDRLSAYPKCSKAIHLSQPDLQGPYDILHLIIGAEAFYIVHDDPKLTKELLSVITQTYVDYRKLLMPHLDATYKDASFVHGFLVGGQVLFKCDTASANLTVDMCKEFECDYIQKGLVEFYEGSLGSIHSCGDIRPEVLDLFIGTGMRSMNYGNPEKHDIAKYYPKHFESKTCIVGWGFNMFYDEYIHTIRENGIKTGITLMAKAHDAKEGIDILKRHRGE